MSHAFPTKELYPPAKKREGWITMGELAGMIFVKKEFLRQSHPDLNEYARVQTQLAELEREWTRRERYLQENYK